MPGMVLSLLFYLLIFLGVFPVMVIHKRKSYHAVFSHVLVYVSKILENQTEIGFVLLACFATSSRLNLRQWKSFGVTKDNKR